jgi:ParB/RepB/Spo0J family partition protein
MTSSAANWQLDRLSAGAREAAEIASLGAGLSLSAWLTRLIGENCAAEGVAPASEPPKILEFTREIRERAPFAPRPAVVPAPMAAAMTPPAPPVFAAPPQEPPHVAPVQAAPIYRAPTPPAPPAPPRLFDAVPIADSTTPNQTAGVAAVMLPTGSLMAANLGTRRGDDVPESLLADIATRGVRQPLVVRRAAGGDRYEIICGHRRWRAAQRVGLGQVPAVIVTNDDAQAILASLSENLQVGNLSAIEEAQAYLRLLTHCATDASIVTAATGRDRQHIVRSMRLLGLPPLVRHLVSSGLLGREHAYLLLDAPNPEALADAIIAEHLSVDAARQRVAAAAKGTKP